MSNHVANKEVIIYFPHFLLPVFVFHKSSNLLPFGLLEGTERKKNLDNSGMASIASSIFYRLASSSERTFKLLSKAQKAVTNKYPHAHSQANVL
jgi:hypothetical protein